MRAVLALPQPPSPEGGAAGRTAVALIRGLREHGVDVTAFAARHGGHIALPAPPDELGVRIVEVPTGGWRSRAIRLVRPMGALSFGDFANAVEEASRSADVVHLEEIDTAELTPRSGIPTFAHLHYLIQKDVPWGAPWQPTFRRVLEHVLAERRAATRHRRLIANSRPVADALRRLAPRAEIVVAPLALDPMYYTPASLDGPPVAGLIGTASWEPTAASTRRLVERIWPRVRRVVPEAKLMIAGRGMDSLGIPEGEGVTVVGAVPSSAAFLRSLSLMLYPIERGSGMKVKVLEALATGLPVVTTDAGAEGVDPSAGIVVENEDEPFASAAVEVLIDEAERKQRGALARAAFLERYSPKPATEPIVDAYRRATGEI